MLIRPKTSIAIAVVCTSLLIAIWTESAARANEPVPSVTGKATIESRVRALENKTDYYEKRIRRSNQSHTKSDGRAICPGGKYLSFSFGTTAVFGTTYAWVTTTVNYKSNGSGGALQEIEAIFTAGPNSCVLFSVETSPSGDTFTLKRFCSVDISPGDRYGMRIFAGAGPNVDQVNPCEYILSANIEMKATEIQLVEPD